MSKSNNFVLHVIQNAIQSHRPFRMLRTSFRTVMISATFYDSSINVLDYPWQKHFKRNQVMEK